MKCPKCGTRAAVINGRSAGDGAYRRRRACPICHHRFTTYETQTHPDKARYEELNERTLRGVLTIRPRSTKEMAAIFGKVGISDLLLPYERSRLIVRVRQGGQFYYYLPEDVPHDN